MLKNIHMNMSAEEFSRNGKREKTDRDSRQLAPSTGRNRKAQRVMIENAGAGRDSQETNKKANGIHAVTAGHLLAIYQGKLVMSAIGKA